MKSTFIGAGSTVFVKNVLGDTMLCPALWDAEFALYDIDAQRLEESRLVVESMNRRLPHHRNLTQNALDIQGVFSM